MSDISFIITTYNYSKYIEECIESIINQSEYDANKVMIVDDGSNDNTYKLVKKYLSKQSIEYFQIENSGVEVASNYAINKVKTSYFTRIDADDSLKNDYLSKFDEVIKFNREFSFIYSNYSIINESSKFIKQINLPPFDKEEVFKRGDFLATGTLYKKEDFDLVNQYNTSKKNCGLENYSLILRLLINGCTGLHIPFTLFNYRIHLNNMSKQKKRSILQYGNELTNNLLKRPYEVNCNHPYGLKID